MTDMTDEAKDRIAVDVARLYVRLHMVAASEMFPAWAIMSALTIELGHMCRRTIETNARTPEDIRRLLTLIEKIALNPTDESIQ